jgi:hypothetical protein
MTFTRSEIESTILITWVENTTETVRYQHELILTTIIDTHVLAPPDYPRYAPGTTLYYYR